MAVLTGTAMVMSSLTWEAPKKPPAAPTRPAFSEDFQISVADIAIARPRGLDPKFVKTERILPPAPAPEPVSPRAEVTPPTVHTANTANTANAANRSDICRGKGRVATHGGRSWRCRR